MKVYIYLDYPKDNYYEFIVSPDTLLSTILHKLEQIFPKDMYTFNTNDPVFIDMKTGIPLDRTKTYTENCLASEQECFIKVGLKIYDRINIHTTMVWAMNNFVGNK